MISHELMQNRINTKLAFTLNMATQQLDELLIDLISLYYGSSVT
jgi:hypothetical protein